MIIQLTTELINKIAAGEVVERPSSVVKELVENSIDANASEISIEVSLESIKVIDNGDGIKKEDLEKLFINHSTSKIKSIDDLSHIFTMGFRGEAIATIAAVSKMIIRSKYKEDKLGYSIKASEPLVSDALNTGTVVEVKDLFYNVPARKKFLKSITQENKYITDTVRRISLAYPYISFKLTINSKVIFNLLSSTLEQRIRSLITNIELIPIINDDIISGYISKPKDSFSKAIDQYMFVNNRYIIPSPALSKAVFLGYKNALMRGQYPPYVIFINVDPITVDVNVHPRKTEVRFENEGYIFQKIYTLIQHTLFKQERNILNLNIDKLNDYSTQTINKNKELAFKQPNFVIKDQESNNLSYKTKTQSSEINSPYNNSLFGKRNTVNQAMKFSLELLQQQNPINDVDLNECKQYMSSYIIASSTNGIIMFDQHACSERYLFEKYKCKFEKEKIQVKQLLIPELIPHEFEDFMIEKSELLLSFGLEVRKENKSAFIFGIPEFASLKIIDKVYAEIRNIFDSEINSIEDLRDKFITTLACHSAIRFGDSLNTEECKRIITDLNSCNNKLTCPHGRPTYYELDKEKLVQIFKR